MQDRTIRHVDFDKCLKRYRKKGLQRSPFFSKIKFMKELGYGFFKIADMIQPDYLRDHIAAEASSSTMRRALAELEWQ